MSNTYLLKSPKEYQQSVEGLDEFGHLLVNLIKSLLASDGIPVHSVVHRVKAEDSAMKKLASKPDRHTHVGSLTDLLGLRVITYFPDTVDAVSMMLEKEFQIDPINSVDKRRHLEPDRFGYLSVHYIVSLHEKRCVLGEYAKFAGVKFEIQTRSILQHAWAEIEHDIGYKAGQSLPTDIRRRFSRVAGLLEVADEEFKNLRDLAQKYQESVDSKISQSLTDLPLDQMTVASYVAQRELPKMVDREIAEALHVNMATSTPKSLFAEAVALLEALDIRTIPDLDARLAASREKMLELVQASCAAEIPRGETGTVYAPPGFFLFYLIGYLAAHATSAQKSGLRTVAKTFETNGIGFAELILDALDD